MNGLGIIKGLGVTLRHFFDTYFEDLKWAARHYTTAEGVAQRSSSKTRGIFTVQYPEEKLLIPEEFRYLPFLVYDVGLNGAQVDRCTSCGICAKVCPPQCIWIERTNDPKTGRPIPAPAEFYIDMDICMNCGLCAEYCPFDAIKMDHDFEIASYSRMDHHIYNKAKLSKPASYYVSIRPKNFALEETARLEKEAKLASKKSTVKPENPPPA
jgi:NADH-quinone oxidoreductase subunit I